MFALVRDWCADAHGALFSEKRIHRLEQVIVALAVVGFFIHLAVIIAVQYGTDHDLGWFSASYLAAVYTPFSFLLLYEVVLLVAEIPGSFTRSMSRLLEVATLIVLRRIFKDIAELDALAAVSLTDPALLHVGADMVGSLGLFAISIVFRRGLKVPRDPSDRARGFIAFKRALASALFVVVVVLSVKSLLTWGHEMVVLVHGHAPHLSDVNTLFYRDFFGLLVMADILVLLVSFGLTRSSIDIVRNAGYVAATVLVRLSFTTSRLQSILMLLGAGLFSLGVQRLTRWAKTSEERGELQGDDDRLEPIG